MFNRSVAFISIPIAVLTYSPLLLPYIRGGDGLTIAIIAISLTIYSALYLLASRSPFDLAILSAPPIAFSIWSMYTHYAGSIISLATDVVSGIQVILALAVLRIALRSRKGVPAVSGDLRRYLSYISSSSMGRVDTIMLSLGASIAIVSTIDLAMVLSAVSSRPVILENPVVVSGILLSSFLIASTGVSRPLIAVLPVASWGAAFYLYASMASMLGSEAIGSKAYRSIEIPGIHLEGGAILRIPIDTGSSPHILVSGNTGSGKTTLCKVLAKRLRDAGVGVIVIDYHGEYRDLEGFEVVEASEASPQILPKTPDSMRILELVDSVRKVFRLGALQVSTLSAIAEEAVRKGGRGFRDLLAAAEDMLERSREDPRARDMVLGVIPYLRVLATHIRGEPIDLEAMLSKRAAHMIFDMSNIGSEYASIIYAEYLLKHIWRYEVLKGQKAEVDLAVIIDEAHNLLKGSAEEFISRIFRESRKYGLSLIISTQQFEMIPPEIVNNTNIFFFLRHTDPRVLDSISALTTAGEVPQDIVKDTVRSLKPLQGVIYIASERILRKISIAPGPSRGGISSS